MKGLANFISYSLHPVFLFTYLYLIHWWLYPYPESGMHWEGVALLTGLIFLNTAVIPVALLLVRKMSLVNQDRGQRQKTIVIVMVIYSFTYFLFPDRYVPDYLMQTLLAIILGLVVCFIVNYSFKISLHASAWGGFLSVILFLLLSVGDTFYALFLISVLCAGLVGFSRLYLQAHTDKELYSGYVSGFVVTSIILFA